ncbi:MAG: hypothetical protein L0Y67_04440 [Gammaproteobacteria bacterium]|nr:hypothetical protein [Gammaproteobacteria bacterium]
MKPMLFTLYLLVLVPMTLSAQTDHTHSPASTEDCTKLSPELQAVVAAMEEPGAKIEALAKAESSLAIEPGIHKLEVTLRPLSEVWLVEKESLSRQTPGPEGAMAEKTKPKENVESLFGGFVQLTVPKDGMYRVSVDSPIWIEVIDGKTPIERVRIVPRLHCGRIHKSLGFPLNRERSYWLEISGSKRPDVTVLITEEREH